MLSGAKLNPVLLINHEEWDFKKLADDIIDKEYFSLDEDVPVCRYRGTAIRKTENGYEILGWERNVSRIQKMDASLPAILSLTLDAKKRVSRIQMDSRFSGSKGVLCYYPFLNNLIVNNLTGKILDPAIINELQIEKVCCFHISEIMLSIVSCLQLMEERFLDHLFEEEVLDGVRFGNNVAFAGLQKFSFMEKPTAYQIDVENALNTSRFDSDGNIYSDGVMDATSYFGDQELFHLQIGGNSEKRIYIQLNKLCAKTMETVRKQYTSAPDNRFLCTVLQSQAFIGVFIQSIAIKMFNNNYTYILHCLKGIQRYSGNPRCIGSVTSQKEADDFFPGFCVADALCGD